MRAVIVSAGLLGVLSSGLSGTDRFPAAAGDIVITPLIHSSVQIEYGGTVIHVDPWSAADLSRAKAADLILISDDPLHHLDPEAIKRLRKPDAPIMIPAVGLGKVPDGIVLANGESTVAAGVRVESIAAYDLTPGAPEHPKGKAKGYVLTLGGKRIYLASVTECVPELMALKDIDIAFLPMNIPPARMSPVAVAECAKALKPKVVYLYHYDQDYASRVGNPQGGASNRRSEAAQPSPQDLGVERFVDLLKGESIEFRHGNWYPERR